MTQEKTLIHRSVGKLLLLAIGSGAFVAACFWIVTGDSSSYSKPSTYPAAWLGIVCFGFSLFFFVHKLLFGPRIPLELSPNGFLDRRLFTNEVSWTSVRGVHLWSHKGVSLVAVQLTSDAVSSLEKTYLAKAKTQLNLPFGKNIVYVAITDLEIQADQLLWTFRKYLKKYNSAPSEDI
ncbi:MAG: STM3941 family protein [Pseudomonadota bacterium]